MINKVTLALKGDHGGQGSRTHPEVAGMAEVAPKLNPVVVEDAGAAAAPKLNPFALESSVLAAPPPEPKEKGDGEEVV